MQASVSGSTVTLNASLERSDRIGSITVLRHMYSDRFNNPGASDIFLEFASTKTTVLAASVATIATTAVVTSASTTVFGSLVGGGGGTRIGRSVSNMQFFVSIPVFDFELRKF